MLYVSNSFSKNMFPGDRTYSFIGLSRDRAAGLLNQSVWHSVVGHDSTANLLSSELGMYIPYNRQNVALDEGDAVLLAQYVGPRLEEGTTKLPDGARIEFYLVEPVFVNEEGVDAIAYGMQVKIKMAELDVWKASAKYGISDALTNACSMLEDLKMEYVNYCARMNETKKGGW